MINTIKINSGKNLFQKAFENEKLQTQDLISLVRLLDNSHNPYCIVVNIIDNTSYNEYRDHVDRVQESLSTLSPRELEVLRLAVEGNSNITISEKLFISVETVKSHRKSIVSKVGVRKVSDIKQILYKSSKLEEIVF